MTHTVTVIEDGVTCRGETTMEEMVGPGGTTLSVGKWMAGWEEGTLVWVWYQVI